MPFALDLDRPITPSNIPSPEEVLEAAKPILTSDTVKWKPGAKYDDGRVHTFTSKINGHPWAMRKSVHGSADGTFEEFWEGLGVNHAVHESQYIPMIQKASLVTIIETGTCEVWNLHYNFSPVLQKRSFTVLIVSHLEPVSETNPLRQGWVVSMPFDPTSDPELAAMEEKGVRGRYLAVERIQETLDGKVDWRMATCSDVGGVIPEFIAAATVPKQISHVRPGPIFVPLDTNALLFLAVHHQDVEHFLKFMRAKRNQRR
ncbi:hypothetical protein FRC04_005038 [Tulasnella sp. 424]|nr:hypothetical protein FRC04_005038 [Tulasnella sp. 424]KAG8963281.1 hypothetical protein FRC05_004797 [Tulasnella sp. 425]